MRALIQRVGQASVVVGSETVGQVGAGLCVLLGVTHTDTSKTAHKMADRLAKLRIFADDSGKMNRSVADIGGEILLVSQFTLYADTKSGNRPSFGDAAGRQHAEPLVDEVITGLRAKDLTVASGRFGEMMQVNLTNDGPVTVTVDVD